MDTYCFGGGYLTALDLDSREVLQADHRGHMRRDPFKIMTDRLARCGRGLASLLRIKSSSTKPSPKQTQPSPSPPPETKDCEPSEKVDPAPTDPNPLITGSVGETLTNPEF